MTIEPLSNPSSYALQVAILLLTAVLLAAAPSAAHRSLAQTSSLFPDITIKTPQVPASLPVDGETKSLLQGAINDVFSAFAYSSDDQQKISQTPKPQPGVPSATLVEGDTGLSTCHESCKGTPHTALCTIKAEVVAGMVMSSLLLQCTAAPTTTQSTSRPPAPPATSQSST